MKLTLQVMLGVAAGLRGLDGYDKIVKDGERERVVKEYYKLGGGLRLLIAKNLNLLDVQQVLYQKARAELVRSMLDDTGEIPKNKTADFLAEERKMLEVESEIDLAVIKPNELNLDVNPIPGTTLSLIQPILE